MRASKDPVTGPGNYPPPVYAVAEDRRSVPPAGIFWWLGSTILLGAVLGLVAGGLPARRAAAIEPVDALRGGT